MAVFGYPLADLFTAKQRSAIMAQVKSGNTTPEMTVRSLLHQMGFRFRLHDRALPGRPDIVLARYRTVVFVNGCFWHGHKGCPRAARPTSNLSYWNRKLDRNISRDETNRQRLRALGWRILVLWECEISRKKPSVTDRLARFMGRKPSSRKPIRRRPR